MEFEAPVSSAPSMAQESTQTHTTSAPMPVQSTFQTQDTRQDIAFCAELMQTAGLASALCDAALSSSTTITQTPTTDSTNTSTSTNMHLTLSKRETKGSAALLNVYESLTSEKSLASLSPMSPSSGKIATEDAFSEALASALFSADVIHNILFLSPERPAGGSKLSRDGQSPVAQHVKSSVQSGFTDPAGPDSRHVALALNLVPLKVDESTPRSQEASCECEATPSRDLEIGECGTQITDDGIVMHDPVVIREQKLLLEESERQHRGITKRATMCTSCHRRRKPTEIFRLSVCFHSFCLPCLRTHVRENIQKGCSGEIHCPLACCNVAIDHGDMKMFLSPADFDMFMSTTLDALVSNNPHFFRCPNKSCRLVMERIDVDSTLLPEEGTILNQEGKPLSAELLRHRAENRFRCPKCTTEFCASCSTTPYHLGFTCQDYELYSKARHCRFCSVILPPLTVPLTPRKLTYIGKKKNLYSALSDVCTSEECINKLEHSCPKVHTCGHHCIGVWREKQCPPCLHEGCAPKDSVLSSDFCNICWTEELGQSPSIKLDCGHYFHLFCIKKRLGEKWNGARIMFSFLNCPLCNQRINHPALAEDLKPHISLYEEVKQKAYTRLLYENLDKSFDIINENGRFYKDPIGYALDRFCYYLCYICQRVYFGGQKQCDQGNDMDMNYDPSELVCGGCCLPDSVQPCKEHGTEFMEYKCCFCCNIATWFCWGRTHFCNDCHEKQQRGDYLTKKPKSALQKCQGPSKCKLKIRHPPNGEEFALGCAICRIRQSF